MFFGFLWLIIIVIIAMRFVNAAKENEGRSGQAGRRGTPVQQGRWTNAPAAPQAARPAAQQMVRPAAAQPARPAAAQPARPAAAQPVRPAAANGGAAARPDNRRYAQPARPVSSSSYPAKGQDNAENSILQRARANASERFDEDALRARGTPQPGSVPDGNEIVRDRAYDNHIHSVHGEDHGTELRNQPGVDDFDTYHLADEVNDLIVKGYSGNLEFERDFLAEGIDMLNRFSV